MTKMKKKKYRRIFHEAAEREKENAEEKKSP